VAKHRRPSRLARLGQVAHSPVQLGIAAGVAGTVAVTGTVVASAAPNAKPAEHPERTRAVSLRQAVINTADLGHAQSALALEDAVTAAQQERAQRIARAEARAEARAKARAQARREAAAEKRRAQRRAAARQAAKERAAASRTLASASASRGVERMSASASNVLQVAAAAASGAYYSYAGTGPSGFDCSGFTSYVFSKVGVSLPHSSSAQRGVVQSVSNPQPGDLVFVYNGGGGSIGHVAIYAGGGYWWEASNPSSGVGKHRAWSSAVSYGRVL